MTLPSELDPPSSSTLIDVITFSFTQDGVILGRGDFVLNTDKTEINRYLKINQYHSHNTVAVLSLWLSVSLTDCSYCYRIPTTYSMNIPTRTSESCISMRCNYGTRAAE